MTDRLKGMRRILKVHDQLKRTADWRLAAAERTAVEIDEAKGELQRFIGRGLLTGAFASAAVAQARRLETRGAAAAQAVAVEAEAMRDATARQKLVAKSVEALAREEAGWRERKDLERLIEGLAARGVAAERDEG